MTRQELHQKLGELLYIEDYGMIDIVCASIIANSLKLGDPVWLTLIGPSSGGKSQIIRPFGAATKLIHRIDDLTPNTLLSGSLGIEGSLLGRIGPHGIISMDDLTVLFSKNAEARGEILSQFRMLYDGAMTKSSGNRKEAIVWKGYLGMISGSTPSIYRYFAEVADMGERFINYRMKSFDKHKAVKFISDNNMTAKELDDSISEILKEFMSERLQDPDVKKFTTLSREVVQVIENISEHSTLMRTAVHVDERSGFVDEFPEPEMPFRVQKQLTYVAQGLQAMNGGPLTEDMIATLEWTAWSLANDKRRAYLRYLVGLEDEGKYLTARNVSACTGLATTIVEKGLDQFQALGVIKLREGEKGSDRRWELCNKELAKIVRRLDPPEKDQLQLIDDDL